MAKAPAFQFYTGDWMKDPKLSKCSPSTRGIWMDAMCAMHESDRSGTLEGTADQLIRVLRCSLSDLRAAVAELKATGAGDVTERNGKITLVCRRMEREYQERLGTRTRVAKYRGNKKVTPLSSSSSSTSVYKKPGGSFADRVEALQ